MINIVFAARPEKFHLYEAHLKRCLSRKGIAANLTTACAPEDVDYLIYAPDSTIQDLTPYTRCKAVLSLWAGVETFVGNETLTQPLCRMVDSGLRQGMTEWVTGHTLRYHLGMDQHIVNPGQIWDEDHPPLAQDRPVTILGLGALGEACGTALRLLGFPVTGWSRTAKDVAGITCYHGPEGLGHALATAQILILLLPDTPQTKNVLNNETLAQMPKGSVIINPGRGPLIDDKALISALKQGHISAACLDVFRVEPLPQDHPYWTLPNVTVTPHIASGTRAATAAEVVVGNIARGEQGLPFLHLVDRAAGY
jgi:glyoxylate/hydroxypyruvate reductase A